LNFKKFLLRRNEISLHKWILIFLSLIGLIASFSSKAEANHRWNLSEGQVYNPSEFKELEIGNRIVYWHQRMIGESKVEKDRIVFQFDRETQGLLDVKIHWREDLVPVLPKLNLTQAEAESMVEGTLLGSTLYIISPESDIFSPIKPTPENPCWALYSIDETKGSLLTVIDAVEGTILGYGIRPPHTGFSMSGPCEDNPCRDAWFEWYLNARERFESMGYDTWWLQWPTEEELRTHIGSDTVAMFYEVAHGDWVSFDSGCDGGLYETTWVDEVENWIAAYSKMPFTFLASCDAMCYTGDGTLSHAFRKGSMENTATVGYCHMADPQTCFADCWELAVDWQRAFFGYLEDGDAVKDAFDKANLDYPECGNNRCMRFAGDENLRVVDPILTRNCLPDCHPDYDEWVLMERPDCWCTPYQCDGDADVATSGWPFYYRVYNGDLSLIVDNWEKKAGDPTLDPCADVDHKDSGFPFYYRVYTNDLAIINTNWQKTDAELPGDCAECGRGQQASASLSFDEMARWLDDVWLDPEVRKLIEADRWERFVLSVLEGLQAQSANP